MWPRCSAADPRIEASKSVLAWASLQNRLVGYFNRHVAFDDRLATQPRVQRQPVGQIETILFVVLHLGEVLFTPLHYDVTCRTCAVAPASVFERYAEVQSDIQKRSLQAVLMVRRDAGLILDRLGLAAR